MTPPKPAVFNQVSYFYPQTAQPALLDIDLEIGAGEILGVIGATGAGKTTLCLAFAGIVPQFYGGRFFGRLLLAGLDTVDHPIHELSRHVALVFQDPETQLVTAKVEEEVAFPLENLCVPPDEIRRRVAEALAAVHLEAFAQRHPEELSGGQQQRLALAAALAMEPRLIVLDEPTSQLDPRATAEVFGLVREINRERGTAFVIASHASEEMAETAHRIVVLSQGRIVAEGKPEEVYSNLPLLDREKLRPPEVTATFAKLGRSNPPVKLADGLREIAQLTPSQAFKASDATFETNGLPLLSLRDVTYSWPGGAEALRGVSLEIARGDYVLIAGQNGAGKSTLVKHFLNLLRPTSGDVLLDGVPIATTSVAEIARRIGYVPQNPDRQIFNATVEAEVGFSLRNVTLPPEEKARRIDEALAALDLTRHRHAHPFTLSRADRARVVVAAVLVMNPEALIFDEPTTGQDDHGARAILDLTRRLHAEGRTIVVITHHLYLMPGYARRMVVMGGGRVLVDAPLREAFHAVDLLERTHLPPTQAVALARAAHPDSRAITPAEVAASFSKPPETS